MSTIIKSLLAGNFSEMFKNIIIIIPFGIGVIVGIILVAKLIKFLMNRYETTLNMGVLRTYLC